MKQKMILYIKEALTYCEQASKHWFLQYREEQIQEIRRRELLLLLRETV